MNFVELEWFLNRTVWIYREYLGKQLEKEKNPASESSSSGVKTKG